MRKPSKKKIIILCNTIIVLLTLIVAVYLYWLYEGQYRDWQTVTIEGCGTLKMPENWNYSEEDGYIYITDNENKPVMIQSYSFAGPNDNEEGIVESNKYFAQVQNLKRLYSEVFSNGAIIGETCVLKDNKTYDNYYIYLSDERRVILIVWDKSLDYDDLKDIARTYSITYSD